MDLALAPSEAVLVAGRQWLAPVQAFLGADLVTAGITGGALQADFDPARSRINLLVVVRELPIARLDALAAVLPRPRKGAAVDPMVLTLEQVQRSLDVFPIEWLDVRERHFTLAGEPLFATLEVPQRKLRLQIEQELRGKHLRLMQAYLAGADRPADLHATLAASASGFHTIFRALIRLHGEPAPGTHDGIVSRLAQLHDLDATALGGARRMRALSRAPGADETRATYRAFLAQIERLTRVVDGFAIP